MDFINATHKLAYDEFRRLSGSSEYELKFELNESLPSFEISYSNGFLTITAPNTLEMLYGVYDFAEKFLGYCFFEPGHDRFEKSDAVKPTEGILVPARAPLLKRRGFIQEFPFDSDSRALADWMVKNKLNYLLVHMKYYDETDSGLRDYFAVRGIEIESGHHNFEYWIPGRRYRDTNPDFFAEIGGKRIAKEDGKSEFLLSEQLCTTNPQLRREIVKNMIAYCRANPQIKTISLVPNDGFGWCECPECSKFYDKNEMGDFYSVSEHVYKAGRIYHDMVRDIIGMLSRELPDINVTFVAYINYCSPSPGFVLEKNMAVHMANYWRCINHRIDNHSCPINSKYARDILNWTSVKRGGEVNIYEYYMGVNFYISLPMIHHIDIFAETQWYHDHHVDGVLTQFHIPHWTVYGLNYYLMGKAFRGENRQEAIDFTMRRLFGKDAAMADKFYSQLKELLLSAGECHIPYPYSLLSRTRLEQYQEIQKTVQALAAHNPSDRFRKELVVWIEYLVRFKQLFDAYHRGEAGIPEVEKFSEWVARQSNTRVMVQSKVKHMLNAWCDAIREGKEWLHFNIEWEDKYIRKHAQRSK